MSSTKTGEKAQLTVNKPTADTDTSHPTNKPASFPWTSLSQEEILHEIQKGIGNLTGPNKDSLKLLLPNVIDTKIGEKVTANIPIDKASTTNTASTAILTPFGCFPAIKATNSSSRTTTSAASDQSACISKPTENTTTTKVDQDIVNHNPKSESEQAWDRLLDVSAHYQNSTDTTPAKVNQVIVNQTPKSESEQAWDRFLGVSIRDQDSATPTTAAADPTSDATKLGAAGRPHYDLEDLLEDSTSATITPEDATLVVAAVEENHLKEKEVRRAFCDGYKQGVEYAREQDSSSGSSSDDSGFINSVSDGDD